MGEKGEEGEWEGGREREGGVGEGGGGKERREERGGNLQSH